MVKRAKWVVVLFVVLATVGTAAVVGFGYLSASIEDPCSVEFRICSQAATDWAQRADCRIEIYHCRTQGEFTHPDGTIVRVPLQVEP